jgi:hypothetical protein
VSNLALVRSGKVGVEGARSVGVQEVCEMMAIPAWAARLNGNREW